MANPREFHVGIIGAGHIFEFHIQALQRLQNVKIVGVADLDVVRARSVAEQFRLPHYFAGLDEMVAAGADVVHVLTPPSSHAELTLRAIELGCHVFVEKPLATSVADCERIAAAAHQANRIVGVDHSLLRDPFTVKALQAVQRGAIGDVLSVDCLRSQDYPAYSGGPLPPHYREGGFPFRDLGIHALYQIEAFLGAIQDVTWQFQHRGDDTNLRYDEWRATVQCSRGTGHVHLSWNVRPLQDVIIVQGTRGVLRVDRFGMYVSAKKKLPLPEHPQRLISAIGEGCQSCVQVPLNLVRVVTKRIRRYHGLQTMVAEFYEQLAAGRQATVTPEDAGRVVHWVEQVAQDADRCKQSFLQQFPETLSAKTLVTGATGFIGGRLLQRLLRDGQHVRILARRRPPAEILEHPQIEVVFGDLGDPDVVDRAVAGIDLIYHVGGTVHGAAHDFVRGSVAGTRNVVHSALKHGVKKLVYISSLSVLHAAAGRDDLRITEAWPLEPHPERRGYYTQTKLAAERIVSDAARSDGLPVVILRPAEVIGCGAPVMTSGVAQRVKNRLIIFGKGKLDVPLVDVEDLVDAIIGAAQSDICDGSVFHVVDECGLTQTDLAKRYIQQVAPNLRLMFVPRPAIYLAAIGIETLCRLLRRSAPLSVYRLDSALAPRPFDCQAARDKLGWEPRRGVQQGLQDAMDALCGKINNHDARDSQKQETSACVSVHP